jgi:hypothetical protein
MKTKTLATNKQGELQKTREVIAGEIREASARLYTSMEQVRRNHYFRLGELFIQLRITFQKGNKGDREFAGYCREQFPGIKDPQRNEYVAYRKALKRRSTPSEVALPSMRTTVFPDYDQKNEPARRYKQIVEEEISDVEPFEIKRQPPKEEDELVLELADKIITTGFKILAVKLHPDKDGGSNDAMRRLNKAKKLLSDALTHASTRLLIK